MQQWESDWLRLEDEEWAIYIWMRSNKRIPSIRCLETHWNRANSSFDNNVGDLVLKLISTAYKVLTTTERVPSGQLPAEVSVHNTYQWHMSLWENDIPLFSAANMRKPGRLVPQVLKTFLRSCTSGAQKKSRDPSEPTRWVSWWRSRSPCPQRYGWGRDFRDGDI